MIPGEKKQPGFWRGRARSFVYAWAGIKRLFGREKNAQFHLGAAIIVVAAGLLLGISHGEWVAVTLCIFMMFMAEGFNTAIEYLADRIYPEYDELIGRAKDVAAGAVLLMAVGAVIVGLIIFVPRIINLLF